jgi:hypothetical protein
MGIGLLEKLFFGSQTRGSEWPDRSIFCGFKQTFQVQLGPLMSPTRTQAHTLARKNTAPTDRTANASRAFSLNTATQQIRAHPTSQRWRKPGAAADRQWCFVRRGRARAVKFTILTIYPDRKVTARPRLANAGAFAERDLLRASIPRLVLLWLSLSSCSSCNPEIRTRTDLLRLCVERVMMWCCARCCRGGLLVRCVPITRF